MTKPTIIGKRVRLIHTSDPYTRIRPGDEGTVDSLDDLGTVHVLWDSGSSLGMVRGEDQFAILD